MGYRSDVAYVIQFESTQQRDEFVSLMLAKNDKHTTEAINECEYGYKDDPLITFKAENVKWYSEFDDVKAHKQLCNEANEIYNAIYRCVEMGEDGAVTEDAEDNGGELEGYVYPIIKLSINFPPTTQE